MAAAPPIESKVPPAGGGTAATGRTPATGDRVTPSRGPGVSEFELAAGFLTEFVAAARGAEGRTASVSDATEFARYCGRADVEPTAERLNFARDLALVVRDGLVADGLVSDGLVPDGLVPGGPPTALIDGIRGSCFPSELASDPAAARPGTHTLHALDLAEALEDRGWPLTFLTRQTGGVRPGRCA